MNTIQVKYEKQDNYPHDRKLILFDRSAFQKIHRDVLLEVNKKYNILCSQVFVMECIAPDNTDKKPEEELEKDKEALLEKLKLIENPIVLSGPIHISHIIGIPLDVYNPNFLTSEQIAGNCIANLPITMKRIEPDELISYYESRVPAFKSLMKGITERVEKAEGTLTLNKMSLYVQQIAQQIVQQISKIPVSTKEIEGALIAQQISKIPVSAKEIKGVLKQDEQTYVRQTLSYCAEKTLREIESKTMGQHMEMFGAVLGLAGKYADVLRSEVISSKRLTMENYPHLAYPIYIYYLFNFIIYARQINAEHLDKSYWRDFRYMHYLNFCDMFIANEKSTQHIVNSIPYDDIRETPIITAEELGRRLM